eukprot:maker-scaffold706_size108852-snap-gene-0.17 protein:Tk07359 transcript:maker-scaffold706_size108852-snap-gene-0.17-mRNA-1 annotation:"GM26080"
METVFVGLLQLLGALIDAVKGGHGLSVAQSGLRSNRGWAGVSTSIGFVWVGIESWSSGEAEGEMAFLRSDVINKDLIDNVLSKVEGTTKIVLETLTVGPSTTGKASLLEERYGILVTAKVKHQPQTYYWIAKVLSPEIETSNYARFQGILETECNFYAKFIPELSRLGAPLPQFYPLVHCNYAKLGREILLLEDMTKYGFKQSVCDPKGLDLAHTINVIEWLARLHGLGYVSINNHRDGSKGWLSQNPWIRKEEQERKAKAQPTDETDAEGIRSRLMNMAANALKSKVDGTPKVEKCLQRQNWLDDLRESDVGKKYVECQG